MLKAVRLSKPWGPHKVGEVVQVDRLRAAALVERGEAKEMDHEEPRLQAKAPAGPPVDKMVRKSKRKKRG